MKLSDVIKLADAINALLIARTPKPTTFSLKIALNAKLLDPVLKTYEEQRQSLLSQFSVKDDKGEPVLIKNDNGSSYDLGENAKAFNESLTEAQNVEIDIKLQTLSIDKFPTEIDPAIMLGLIPIVEID